MYRKAETEWAVPFNTLKGSHASSLETSACLSLSGEEVRS